MELRVLQHLTNGFIGSEFDMASCTNVCREGKKVDSSIVSDWMANSLPSVLAGYEPRDVFSADESGVFCSL